MVFYFYPQCAEPADHKWVIYMGKDKVENEDLIRFGLQEDVWFHVDNMSSAHVYLRLPRHMSLDGIPEKILEECCQLVKANSIQGCKENNVDIVYTFWSNLKKTKAMEVGQVGFFKQKEVKKYKVDRKSNEIINRLNKTKVEEFPDLQAERDTYNKDNAAAKRSEVQGQKAREKEAADERAKDKELRSYANLMDEEAMASNKSNLGKYATAEEADDDFM